MGASKEYHRAYYLAHKEHIQALNRKYKSYKKSNKTRTRRDRRWEHVKRAYNLSPEEYSKLLEQQNSACAICGRVFSDDLYACVDHDHGDGHIRGVLCRKCNTGLGMFRDNLELLIKAVQYLEKK